MHRHCESVANPVLIRASNRWSRDANHMRRISRRHGRAKKAQTNATKKTRTPVRPPIAPEMDHAVIQVILIGVVVGTQRWASPIQHHRRRLWERQRNVVTHWWLPIYRTFVRSSDRLQVQPIRVRSCFRFVTWTQAVKPCHHRRLLWALWRRRLLVPRHRQKVAVIRPLSAVELCNGVTHEPAPNDQDCNDCSVRQPHTMNLVFRWAEVDVDRSQRWVQMAMKANDAQGVIA